MPTSGTPQPTDRPADILEVFGEHAHVHPYGIADVEQLWERSRWWRRDRAAVGLMDLPGSDLPILYAISADPPEPTLELLADLTPQLPEAFGATGPVGLVALLTDLYEATKSGRYMKMHLAHPDLLPAPDDRVTVLDSEDLADLRDLYATDPSAGDFFHPDLLATGYYLGLRLDGALIATAGIHVIERHHAIAALGNIATHPAHRRRGLARVVVSTLCHRLRGEVEMIGLNVRQHNVAARNLYGQLGFAPSIRYEEAQFFAR